MKVFCMVYLTATKVENEVDLCILIPYFHPVPSVTIRSNGLVQLQTVVLFQMATVHHDCRKKSTFKGISHYDDCWKLYPGDRFPPKNPLRIFPVSFATKSEFWMNISWEIIASLFVTGVWGEHPKVFTNLRG